MCAPKREQWSGSEAESVKPSQKKKIKKQKKEITNEMRVEKVI